MFFGGAERLLIGAAQTLASDHQSIAGVKRPLDALRLPTAQVPSVGAPAVAGKVEEREDRPGLAKRRRRGTGPLSVSWAVQLTNVREYVPNPEEWGRSPRHLHGDDFSDAVRVALCVHIEILHTWPMHGCRSFEVPRSANRPEREILLVSRCGRRS